LATLYAKELTMTTTIIHIDLDAVDERLRHGELWTDGWGDFMSPESATCLHGAIRYCQPVKGDAYLIEQVGRRYGFGIGDNDNADTWDSLKAKVIPDITDDMLSDTFGPQWEPIVALVRRAATLTLNEAKQLGAARDAAWGAACVAAWDAAWDAARGAAGSAAGIAAGSAAGSAARVAAGSAARGLVVRDLIGQHGFSQADYDLLTQPWATVIGKVHPDDADRLVAT
jgi:hypothetical protein